MTTGNRKAEFNIEEKLSTLTLSRPQPNQAVDAMRVAEEMVDFLDTLVAGVKRLAGVFSLKPSVRA